MRTAQEYIDILPGIHHPDFFKKLVGVINHSRLAAIKECADRAKATLVCGVRENEYEAVINKESILSLINEVK